MAVAVLSAMGMTGCLSEFGKDGRVNDVRYLRSYCTDSQCEADAQCPEGQRCRAVATWADPNCLQTPCPAGSTCDVQYEPPHPEKIWMACVARCGEGYPACEAGWACDGWNCVQPCEPRGPEVCAEGYYCHRLVEHRPYSCLPDFWRDRAR